jgi:uncharacterized membrane protein (UPF0127 family)
MATTAVTREDGSVLCARCKVAATPLSRMQGLLGRASLEPDEGIFLKPAGSIHMLFMRFAIDAVFLDRELRVLAVQTVRPWRFASRRGSKAVLELAEGAAESLREGEQLTLG